VKRSKVKNPIPRLQFVEEAMETIREYIDIERFRDDPFAEDVTTDQIRSSIERIWHDPYTEVMNIALTIGGIYKFKPKYSEEVTYILLPTLESAYLYAVFLYGLPTKSQPEVKSGDMVVLLSEPCAIRSSILRFVKVLTGTGDVGWIPFELEYYENL